MPLLIMPLISNGRQSMLEGMTFVSDILKSVPTFPQTGMQDLTVLINLLVKLVHDSFFSVSRNMKLKSVSEITLLSLL